MQSIKRNKWMMAIVGILLIMGLAACSNNEANTSNTGNEEEDAGEPVVSETLKVAYASDPDTLDWSYTGASPTRDVAWHIFEMLFALDNDFAIQPMLAESYEVNEDRTLYTIKVREGVKFHDGSVLTAEDVVASIERWGKISSVGKTTFTHIESVTATSENEVQVKLLEPYNSLLADFAAPKSALMIIPAKVAEAAGEQPLKPEHLIGNGPYAFEKWDRGQEIVVKKFADYSAREEEDWGGLTGKKTAYFNEIKFMIVKDPQVILNGLKTGLYDYGQSIPTDLNEVVASTPNVDPVTYMNGYSTITPDKSEAPFNDIKVRQALNHALDKKVIAEATYGSEEFYQLDGALFVPKQVELYSDKGSDDYLAYDKELAKKLLEESSYNGETLKVVYSSNSEEYNKIAQVAKQQLEEVGFKVELISYEWATYLEKWGDPANWDLVVIGWSTRFSPNELGMLVPNIQSSGWYESPRWSDLIAQWGEAETEEQQKEILTEMNQTVNDELPFIKIANLTTLDIKTNKIKNYENWLGQRFWNTWKAE
ncbi:ABC transporter substrate-binding protein [Psychrobacillus lasiicapitis]|nr:ABC transporter substrate-binding protein [Psychrobacillus lasiicapitis]GGA22959.1 peptide ABC transporter substrate-binding protein [Psychrobacillus lasiicapitis]